MNTTAGLAALTITVFPTFSAGGAGSLGPVVKVLILLASVLVNAAAFLLAFRIATARDVSVADIAPGALAAAIGWQLLQSFGVVYVNHTVRHASATNGVFALVLGLIAFLYLTAVLVVFCVEINVVRVKHLYPRSLLTPFTDNVQLTRGDRRAYTGQATAQASKGLKDVTIGFNQPDSDPRSDRRPRATG